MPDCNVIADIGMTLVKLLEENIPEVKSKIYLAFPNDTKDAKISLFLFKIEENEYLRNYETFSGQNDETAFPPLVLDLYFMITFYPAIGNPEDRYKVMGKVMQVLHDNAILSGRILQGNLAGSKVDFKIIFVPMSPEELSKVWGLYPEQTYMMSIAYMITPVCIESRRVLDSKPVKSFTVNTEIMGERQ